MATFFRESDARQFTNGGTSLACGRIVQLPDGVAGIITAARGVGANEVGIVKTSGQVRITKTSAATAFAAGDRVAYTQSTDSCVPQVGAATNPAFIVGRVAVAAGAGVVDVLVDLNHQGATI